MSTQKTMEKFASRGGGAQRGGMKKVKFTRLAQKSQVDPAV
jgi:hypothetical protein